ncbi:TRAP transporter substrate-binding protein [Pelagibacterium sp. 26DY04]|uniref:TRAP transporter substrate-binding protein n=1 Tax=Pelagibacterium sp. 26DY04 TaxID=2967130 RepID=UPI0028155CEF|nr:TRAP transporter substrate-binding protein [Pelagibacterium sp. 26DY04]WMT85901.1 TRAP transporter substrate-binding protein [Pelagibacterium sp. 26DY04]
MKHYVAGAALSAVLSLGLAAPALSQTATFGGSDALGSLYDRQNRMFVDLVNERSNGELTLNFIEGEQLGTDVQVIEQAMGGAVQFYGDDLSWYSNWVDDYAILGWGFTFHSNDHMQAFFETDTYQTMAQELIDEYGVRLLAQAPIQPRLTFANTPIETADDFNGLKMRVPEIPTYLQLWQTLGASPTRVAWGEVFLGLRTGVIEAAEGPVSAAYAARFHEAAPYVIRTDHILTATHILVNEAFYQSLSPELQEIVTQAAVEATAWAREQAEAETDDIIATMESEGATVSEIDLEPVRERAVEAVERIEAEGLWTPGLWQSVQDMAE